MDGCVPDVRLDPERPGAVSPNSGFLEARQDERNISHILGQKRCPSDYMTCCEISMICLFSGE